MGGVCRVKGLLAGLANLFGPLVVHDLRSQQPETGLMVLGVIPGEELPAETVSVSLGAKSVREARTTLQVLNWLSENGLSSETCGRACVLDTPRSADSKETGLEVIGLGPVAPLAAFELLAHCAREGAPLTRRWFQRRPLPCW